DMNGHYKLTETGAALEHTINHYFDIMKDSASAAKNGSLAGPATTGRPVAGDSANIASSGPVSKDSVLAASFDRNVAAISAGRDAAASARRDTAAANFTPQDWTLRAQFRVSPLVLAYMPTLKGTDTLGAFVSFNSDRNDLHLLMKDPHINIGEQQILSEVSITAGTTGMGSGNGKLAYSVNIAGGHGSGFEIQQTSLSGFLQRDQLFTDLLLKDARGKDRYRLVGRLDRLKGGVKFQLNPDSLLLNYEKWRVGRDNYFQTGSAGIIVHDLTISNGNDSLSVNSNPPSPNAPIDVRFANFRLNTLSHFVEQDSLGVDGLLNGQAQVKNIQSTPIFTSDLLVKSLSFKKDTLGDLAIKINNEKANAFAADISLEGHQNDIKVKGEYYSGESRMNINLNLGQVSLQTFNHVAESVVGDMHGYLKGQLAVSGTFNQPLIKGNLHFDSARMTPVVSGEPLRLSKDNIEFDQDGFNFSQFSLQDSAGNKLTVDGNVYTHDYKTYSFDISVNAGNFRLVNAPEDNSRQFYGSLNLDAAANLTGSIDNLKVDGDLRVNKKTNFYFVLPGSDPEVVDRLGVIRFIDRSQPGDTLVDRAAQQLRSKSSAIKGMDIALNIQTDSSAIFTVVIDERTGDALNIRGRSNLVFGMDKSGKTDLTGSYEVESGSYNLSLDVLKRKFDIQRGSSITWTGDPKTATLDINATYTANTASIDLIANEVAGRPEADVNKFKQKLPFLITLKMEGELLKPKITFDISLPANVLTLWPDVDQKLQQIRNEESELNKQVFALLLLNRFVGEDPLQSQAGGGSTLGNMAFQSASQILTNQLDNLAGSLIKGVEIHFDLNNQQDFSTGSETDYTELNVSVSKRLFDDRVTVNVGSDFDVQGTNNPGQNASNLAGDVAVDYRLSKDGRYMVRAYRKNQYEAVLEGQVVETGVSFILTFDYNKFRELFGKTKEDKLQERKVTHPSGTGPTPAGTTPNGTAPAGKPGSSTGKPSNP
ncbi:MAG TPA: translocation/assembly module TamB domain-containing protein, partial [Puia sp.]|nr:translocation/assembly module TamB domain-containing protein [Puia sp.]